MPKTISCGIAAIRKKNDSLEILLCKPVNAGFYGMGFLKGQMEPNETKLEAAKREFSEESGGLDVELLDENWTLRDDGAEEDLSEVGRVAQR